MKAARWLLPGLALVLVLGATMRAEDKAGKEVTLKGSMVCGKCSLGVCEKCTNVLQVKEDGKDVNYFIDDKGKGEKYHKAICPAGTKQDATVKGVVTEKDGKKWIKGKVEVK